MGVLKRIGKGLQDIVTPIAGRVIVSGGSAIGLIQSITRAQGSARALTDEEKAVLTRVFQNSLDYSVIRMVEGKAGIFSMNKRPFVLGNTIYIKKYASRTGTVVHEATHVWQYQNTGSRYVCDALGAQFFVQNPYSWEKEIDERGKNNWSDWNAEAQAEIFKDIWEKGELRNAAGATLDERDGCFYDANGRDTFGYLKTGGRDYTAIATKAVEIIRKG